MPARSAASIVWILAVLIPPVRFGLERVAQFLWPTASFFDLLERLSPRWVPFLSFVLIGYALTWLVFRYLARAYLSAGRPDASLDAHDAARAFDANTGLGRDVAAHLCIETRNYVLLVIGHDVDRIGQVPRSVPP